MTITKQDASIIGTGRTMQDQYCVFEHWVTMTDNAPPVLIYVGSCRLDSVFKMEGGKNNSDWVTIFNPDRPVQLRIVATTSTHAEARGFALLHIKSMPVMPRCNLHGFNLYGTSRKLTCSNGQEYTNQTEAARALDLNQGAISRHLKGELKTVKGYTFAYKGHAA